MITENVIMKIVSKGGNRQDGMSIFSFCSPGDTVR